MTRTTLASVAAVAKAYAETAKVSDYWADAYAAVAGDLEAGHSVRDISAALQSAKVKANKDTVSDMARAHRLTRHGAYAAGLAAARTNKDGVTESGLLFAHTIIADARKGRGAQFVDGVLSTLESAIADGKPEAEALESAIRSLRAGKRPKAVKPAAETDAATGEESGEETAPTTGEEAPREETTATAKLDAMIKPLAAILQGWERDGNAPDTATVDAFLAVARRMATVQKNRKASAAA